MSTRKKILITGVYGIVGGLLCRHLDTMPEKYELSGLDRNRTPSNRTPEDLDIYIPETGFIHADINTPDVLEKAFRGIDTVCHMAGEADPAAGWERIHQSNITGTYHVFESCRRAGVRRLIYASSLKAVHGYLRDEPYRAIREGRYADVPATVPIVTHIMPTRPVDIYSASKVWGEELARVYAEQHNMSCICLRLGWVNNDNQPRDIENMTLWTSHADMLDLATRCIDAPENVRFEIFFSVSECRYRWTDVEHAHRIVGYKPRDWAEDFIR